MSRQIYSGRSQVDPNRREQPLPDPHANPPPPVVGAVFSPQTTHQQQTIPEVERMRRGRLPAAHPSPQPIRPSPSPSKVVTNGDPFAALDARPAIQGADELSSRFPTLDQFSLLHDKGQKFDFDAGVSASSQPQQKDLSQRVVERLADEAFQIKPSPSPVPAQAGHRQSVELNRASVYMSTAPDASLVSPPPLQSGTAPPKQQPEISRASVIISSSPELQAISSQATQAPFQPPPKPVMVSTGTMTSPTLEQAPQLPLHRFPSAERHRAASVPRSPGTGQSLPGTGDGATASRTAIRTPSLQGIAPQPTHTRYPSSSRPSLEGGRPNLEQLDTARPTSKLASRPRPVSTHLESNLDFLREKEASAKSPALPSPRHSVDRSLPPSPVLDEDTNITSNVDFLRSLEDSDSKKRDRGSKHLKRGSLSSLSAGTKSILAGKFGEAFKKFEGNASGPPPPRTPSPLKDMERRDLTPIAGSEAVDGRSDDGQGDDWEDMTPEMRREQEARMLAQEEARVAAAQAEYRQLVGQRGTGGPTPLPKSIGGVSRAVSIQNKVQSLLDESTRSSATVTRTAQGYGHYSDAAHSGAAGARPAANDGRPSVPKKPSGAAAAAAAAQLTGGQRATAASSANSSIEPSAAGRTTASTVAGRPMAPPKPTHLNTNPATATTTTASSSNPLHPPSAGQGGRTGSPPKTVPLMPNTSGRTVPLPNVRNSGSGATSTTTAPPAASTEALLAVDLPGGQGAALLAMTAAEKDDYIRDFQKRFPSLGAIEMVERDLAKEEADAAAAAAGGRGGRYGR